MELLIGTLNRDVSLIGGLLSERSAVIATDRWTEGDEAFVNATVGGRSVCRLPEAWVNPVAAVTSPPESVASPPESPRIPTGTGAELDLRGRFESLGFAVALKPFRADLHTCRRGDQRGSIDFATGRIDLWGTGRVLSVDQAEREFGEVTEAAPEPAVTAAVEPPAWVRRCVAAGFEIESGPDAIAGNYVARRDGRAYALLPATRLIIEQGFIHHTLAEFEPVAEITMTAAARQADLFGEVA